MRVIAGVARGRRLSAPPGSATRPSTDRLRESLFSALGDRVVDARVLDLFAGSGAIGLEALSRGAATVVFVESDRAALGALRRNRDAVGLGGTVSDGLVERYLGHTSERFDLVFVDPPYPMSDADVAMVLQGVAEALSPDGVVVVHRRKGAELLVGDAMLCPTWQRRYGDAEIWWLQKEQAI